MKSRCQCVDSLRKGSLKGVNFQFCTNCRYLKWEPVNGSTFIKSIFAMEFSGFPETGETVSMSDLIDSIEAHLGSFLNGASKVRIDYQSLGYVRDASSPAEKTGVKLDPEAPFDTKCAKLSEVWIDHRDTDVFQGLFEYADLGFPLAHAINIGMVEASPSAISLITETYKLLLELPVLDQKLEDTITIPLFEDITLWDIRAAEDEDEADYMSLVADRLHEYTTEAILLATLEDMFTEMNDYMQRDTFRELESHFSSFSVSETSIVASVSDMNLIDPIGFSAGMVIEPEIINLSQPG